MKAVNILKNQDTTTNHSIVWRKRRNKSMSYKDELKAKIRELEEKILKDQGEKLDLEVQLNKLRLTEFEEDMKEQQNRKFLKG